MAARDVVGIDHVAVDVDVGNAVGAAAVVGAPQVDPGFEGPVGPAVEDAASLPRPDAAVALHARLDGNGGGMARVAGHQFLHVVHDHLDRAPGGLGQVVAQGNVHEGTLAAKVAADVGGVDQDVVLRHIPHGGQLVPQHERPLVAGPDLHPPIVVNVHHAGVGFQVGLVVQLGGEGVLKNQVRLGEPLLDVALVPDVVGEDVVDARRRLGQAGIGFHAFVQGGGVAGHGIFRVKYGRQVFVLHVNQQQRFLGNVRVIGGHGGHLVAHEQDLVPAQHRTVP